MTAKSRRLTAWYSALVGLAAIGLQPAWAEEAKTPPLVPAGVTLIEVVRELEFSAAKVLWTRPGDASGRTLFVSAADRENQSACVDACAQEFPPLLAAKGAAPVGDWSLVRRADGQTQWAYQGRPLYVWSKEEVAGEVATNVGLTETANSKLAQKAAKIGSLLPPKGWEVARIEAPRSLVLPDGIDASLVSAAQAIVLTDFEGYTLYTFGGDIRKDDDSCAGKACAARWLPVSAPALAFDRGEFSVVTRKDGTRQWAFRGQPLYRYTGDLLPGDVRGAAVDPKWQPALLRQAFRPANVTITRLEGYGDVLAANGLTLYTGSAFEKVWGGRNLRDTFKNAYYKGKKLGTQACPDAECLKTWKPFVAPADATSNGFWEVIVRADGTRQWAYKGFALYTYVGDKHPGDHFGQATYAFAGLEGSREEIERSMMLAEITGAQGGAGVYWNIAKP
jgi:predicted lipoprotein with Yx(FWY)xxD motif